MLKTNNGYLYATKINHKNILTMNELQLIQSKIYEIRGQKVMLDKDLAELYQVTTGNLNKAVQRNIKRFPLDFMFQLTKSEFEEQNLIFQNGTSRWGELVSFPLLLQNRD